MSGETKKSVGRPRHEDGAHRVCHSVRLHPSLSEQVVAAAALSRRSASEEMRWRIEKSFEASDLRTIIREEIEADREQRLADVMNKMCGPAAYQRINGSNNLADLSAGYGRSLSYLNGEPKTDH